MRELDDYDLEAQFAGSALELLRRNSDLSKWRRELFALLRCAGVEGGEAEWEAARGDPPPLTGANSTQLHQST